MLDKDIKMQTLEHFHWQRFGPVTESIWELYLPGSGS